MALDKIAKESRKIGSGLVLETFNPKALSEDQLFGYFDPMTHDWIQGSYNPFQICFHQFFTLKVFLQRDLMNSLEIMLMMNAGLFLTVR